MSSEFPIRGRAIPLGFSNIDTDAIIGAEQLSGTTRAGLGRHAFAGFKRDPESVLHRKIFEDAPVLIAGENFGCGSSREHAVWSLMDRGIRAIIAPSFADIFAENASRNFLLLIELAQEQVDLLLSWPDPLDVDLVAQTVTAGATKLRFDIDPVRKQTLLERSDQISQTLKYDAEIREYERANARLVPWLELNRNSGSR